MSQFLFPPLQIIGLCAVWMHLKPILQKIKNRFPDVDTLHIFSEGPSSQYEQKGNFFLFANVPYLFGFKTTTWSFHASGHGKGIPDGFGATVKPRAAQPCHICDKAVLHGKDIESSIALLEHVKTGISMFHIDEWDISSSMSDMEQYQLSPVPQTMRVHQLITTEKLLYTSDT